MKTKTTETFYQRSPRMNLLAILRELSADPNLPQAEVARRCDLSVAMVNNYLKDLSATGTVEYRRKSSKSVSYHLTSRGIHQLQVLYQQFMEDMVRLYSEGCDQIREFVLKQASKKIERVVLYGSGPGVELVCHSLESAGIRVIGICTEDPGRVGEHCLGREFLNPSQIRFLAPDAVIVSDPSADFATRSELSPLESRGIQVIWLCGVDSAGPINPDQGAFVNEAPLARAVK